MLCLVLWVSDGAAQGFRSCPLPLQAVYLRIPAPAVFDMSTFFAPALVFDDARKQCATWAVEMSAYEGPAYVEVTYALVSATTGAIRLMVATTMIAPDTAPPDLAAAIAGLASASVSMACHGEVPRTAQTAAILRCPVAEGLSIPEGAWLLLALCRASNTALDTAAGALVVRKVRLVARRESVGTVDTEKE
jgi:hypothetical protein